MDELTLIRDFAGDAPLARPATLAPARERLLAEATRPPRRRRALLWVGGPTIATAAAVAAVLTLLPVAGTPPAANAAVVEVLEQAAAHERAQPDVVPRPDQFLYHHAGAYQSWLSIDGTHDGLIDGGDGAAAEKVGGCRDGVQTYYEGSQPRGTEPCEPAPKYLPDMPETKEAMVTYLNTKVFNDPGNPNSVGKDVMSLLDSTYLRTPVRAALFEAATTLPGLAIVPSPPVDGRATVAIAWAPAPGYNGNLVFDAQTHEYLGNFTADYSAPRGTLAVVDAVGDTP